MLRKIYFSRKDNLKQHMRNCCKPVSDGPVEPPTPLEPPPVLIETPARIQAPVPETSQTFACENCSTKFAYSRNLKRHLKSNTCTPSPKSRSAKKRKLQKTFKISARNVAKPLNFSGTGFSPSVKTRWRRR